MWVLSRKRDAEKTIRNLSKTGYVILAWSMIGPQYNLWKALVICEVSVCAVEGYVKSIDQKLVRKSMSNRSWSRYHLGCYIKINLILNIKDESILKSIVRACFKLPFHSSSDPVNFWLVGSDSISFDQVLLY